MLEGSENIGKILLISFKDNEEEIIESVLAALETGRNIHYDEKNINPLKIHYGDIIILLDTRELFRKQKKIDLSFTEFEILHLLMRSPGRVFSKEQIYDIILSLTVVRRKNRCIPCVYWVTAIFVIVLKYSNLFLPFTFFLYCSHFTLCYKLIVCPKTAGFMKIIRNLFSFI